MYLKFELILMSEFNNKSKTGESFILAAKQIEEVLVISILHLFFYKTTLLN